MQRCLETLTKPKKTHKTKKDIQTDATVPKNINGKKKKTDAKTVTMTTKA